MFTEAHEALQILPIKYGWRLKEKADKSIMDSLVRAGNEMIGKFHKTILVKGIKEIKEPTIPIYNDVGIAVAARLNDNMEYVYELALPLGLLIGFIPQTNVVKYSVNVNWTYVLKNPGQSDPPKFLKTTDMDLLYTNNTTGFNGDYTLVK